MSTTLPFQLTVDTSSNSILHRLSRRRVPKPPHLAWVYLVVVAVTYVPLLLAVVLGRLPLWAWTDAGTLPFLRDFGLGYALLVSLPTLVLFLVSDEDLLNGALKEISRDGVIAISEKDATSLKTKWEGIFRRWNLVPQGLAITMGGLLGLATLRLYTAGDVNTWIAPGGHLHLASWIYLYCITLMYILVLLYVVRCILLARFLRAVVSVAPLRILPLHPDRCGGLRPVGRLGLRNQYILTVLGINLVLLLRVWIYSLGEAAPIGDVLIPGAAAYLILGPLIFISPLLPFRAGMQEAKRDWTHEVARVVRFELDRIRLQLSANQITKPDEESLDRLRKVGAAIDELPIWPFDPSTLRKFATAYVVPVLLPLAGEGIRKLLALIST